MDFFGNRTSGDTSIYSKVAGTAGSYNGSPSDYIVSSTYLDRVEEVITWALNNNLIVILDFHGSTLKDEFIDTFDPVIQGVSNPLYTDPTSAKRAADNEKFRAIWSQIAERLKDYSYNVLFEIINEPYFRMSASEMDILNSDIISVIRSTGNNNTDRNIIITGGSENSYEAPLQISPTVIASDDNLIATFHYYWPRAFTASSDEAHNDYDWGNTADKAEIDTDFGAVQFWSQTNNIPVFLGEFGADNEGGYDYDTETYGSFGGPENASRVEYHKYLAEKALELGFAFAAWDAGQKASKTIYLESTRSWVVDVKNALVGSTLSHDTFNKKMSFYPNPAKNIINFKTSTIIRVVELLDLNGKKYKLSHLQSKTYALPNLAQGMYILKAYSEDNTLKTQKILIH
jgi:endoglucanase